MPTLGSVTKTVRISPSDLTVIEDLMKDGTTWSGAIHKLCQQTGTPAEKSPVLREIEDMAMLCGCSLEEFFEQIRDALNDGVLLINRGRVELGLPEWVERFKTVCKEKCLDEEKIGNSAVQAIERGAAW